MQIPLPSKPHWYLLFGPTEDDIKEVCVTTLRLYTRKKVSLVVLSVSCWPFALPLTPPPPCAAQLRAAGEGGREEKGVPGRGQAEGQGPEPGRHAGADHAGWLLARIQALLAQRGEGRGEVAQPAAGESGQEGARHPEPGLKESAQRVSISLARSLLCSLSLVLTLSLTLRFSSSLV